MNKSSVVSSLRSDKKTTGTLLYSFCCSHLFRNWEGNWDWNSKLFFSQLCHHKRWILTIATILFCFVPHHMELNTNFKVLSDIITHFEAQLSSIEQKVWIFAVKGSEMFMCNLQKDCNLIRRQIEDHFARYIHALEARQVALLAQVDIIAEQQSMNTITTNQ